MAAPNKVTVADLSGRWRLNRSLSESMEQSFALQGVPWIARKVINIADIELQYARMPQEDASAATTLSFKQTIRPGGFDSKNDYIVDGEKRSATVPIFGPVNMHCRFAGHGEVPTEFTLGSELVVSEDDHAALVEVLNSDINGWTATTLWGFEMVNGERRFCKYNTTIKGEKRATAKMVYDYLGTPVV
ncbi:hypothetical protein C8A00DRAFT_29391 [Chaetomidium leptoderma]|uniref:Uncharacterized protein n=1 Tax=Chaetomidium leptoderma TaxID=669021 RepID=A0AAN6VUX3_9PEZI|nr:hypothetical protein C8A00DRAFT_29391 [Chaetomidium leptoderma]